MSFAKRMARLRPLTMDELLARQRHVETDPKSASRGGLYRYHSKARRKLADIAQAITEKLAEQRKAATP